MKSFSKDTGTAKKHLKRCSAFISFQGNANQNHNEIHFPTTRIAVVKKKIISVDKNMEKKSDPHTGRKIKPCSRFGKYSAVSPKV